MLATESPLFDRQGGDPYPFVPYGTSFGFPKTLRGAFGATPAAADLSAGGHGISVLPTAQFGSATKLPVGSVVMMARDNVPDDQAIAGADSAVQNVECPVTADSASTGIHGIFGLVTDPDGLTTGQEGLVTPGFVTAIARIHLPGTDTAMAVGTGLMYDFTEQDGALTEHAAGTKCIAILAQAISGADAGDHVYAYVRFNGTYGFGA